MSDPYWGPFDDPRNFADPRDDAQWDSRYDAANPAYRFMDGSMPAGAFPVGSDPADALRRVQDDQLLFDMRVAEDRGFVPPSSVALPSPLTHVAELLAARERFETLPASSDQADPDDVQEVRPPHWSVVAAGVLAVLMLVGIGVWRVSQQTANTDSGTTSSASVTGIPYGATIGCTPMSTEVNCESFSLPSSGKARLHFEVNEVRIRQLKEWCAAGYRSTTTFKSDYAAHHPSTGAREKVSDGEDMCALVQDAAANDSRRVAWEVEVTRSGHWWFGWHLYKPDGWEVIGAVWEVVVR